MHLQRECVTQRDFFLECKDSVFSQQHAHSETGNREVSLPGNRSHVSRVPVLRLAGRLDGSAVCAVSAEWRTAEEQLGRRCAPGITGTRQVRQGEARSEVRESGAGRPPQCLTPA
ncbi:hypothetical protein NDU88_008022 [Pleurodeles waltl]|uniref:Uncharacterized protein n=1 Tax=Pleurodeles waltl TaxID=8319 RepID=A0AAV7RUH1_PLEWA|nr:hypothetical protein NDU88_008022 [Pleurodeles waltl]